MTTQQTQAVPPGFLGSLPEFIVFQTLVRIGHIPDVTFVFQNPLSGGRLERGGLIIDFLFLDPPDLAINVQGLFFHYEQGVTVRARDEMARVHLASLGIDLIFIDEDDVNEDPFFFVREALRRVDHSRLSR